MARPIRFAPVLEGDEAWDFLERVKAMEDVPDPTRPSEERIKEIKNFIRKYELEKLNRGL